jgi:hypothetical protein
MPMAWRFGLPLAFPQAEAEEALRTAGYREAFSDGDLGHCAEIGFCAVEEFGGGEPGSVEAFGAFGGDDEVGV